MCEIAGFCCEVDENCTLLGLLCSEYGNFLPTFRSNLSVRALRVKKLRFLIIEEYLSLAIGPIVCPETSVSSGTDHGRSKMSSEQAVA